MTPETIIAFEGVEQPIAEHALDYGIPASRIVMRLLAGWSVEDAITRPVSVATGMEPRKSHNTKHPTKRQQRTGRAYTLNGETATIAEWSEKTGIKVATINYRLRQGIPFADAIAWSTLPFGPRSRKRMLEVTE